MDSKYKDEELIVKYQDEIKKINQEMVQIENITNPKPKKAEVEIITKETVQNSYRDLRVAHRTYLSKAQTFHRLNKMFLGLDKVDEEFKKIKLI